MLFNSAVFLVLFFVFYLLYWPLPVRGKQLLIILTSFIFYAWYSPFFLGVFLLLICINYYLSALLMKRKMLWPLIVGLVIDIGNLAFFKYFYFFAESAGVLIGDPYIADLRRNWIEDYDFGIELPIAISFYTFQIVAFLVDAYRGEIKETEVDGVSSGVSFRKYVIFILFFPQFIAGPIMRSSDFIPQIDNPQPSRDKMLNGSLLVLQGVIKKVLIADRIGMVMTPLWQNPAEYDATALILAPIAFISQVYCDFSGYTDMARGMAKMIGYEIPENFAGPFLAKSMRELWRRWHITLTMWLRDYIFIPLGGSRVGPSRVYVNVLITMALGGLWHGATWTMFVWGVLLGLILCWEQFTVGRGWQILPDDARWANFLRGARTYLLFAYTAVFFAAPGFDKAMDLFYGIFTFQRANPVGSFDGTLLLSLTALLFNIPQYYPGIKEWLGRQTVLRYVLVFVGTFVVGYLVTVYGDASGQFIYFQF